MDYTKKIQKSREKTDRMLPLVQAVINFVETEPYTKKNDANILKCYENEHYSNNNMNSIATAIQIYSGSRFDDAEKKSVYAKSEKTKEKRQAIIDRLSSELEQYSTPQDAESYMNRLDKIIEKTISELQNRATISIVR